LFGAVGLAVMGALCYGAFWVTWQAAQYGELGDYLIRIGLSWLFLTFLSFLAFRAWSLRSQPSSCPMICG